MADTLCRSDPESLAQVHGKRAPVFSLYLDLLPRRRQAEPLTRLKNLVRQAERLNRVDE